MRTKTWAYAGGAFFGGIAGAWYGSFKQGVFPDDFLFNFSIFILCMVILGGMGNVWGVDRRCGAPDVPGQGRALEHRRRGSTRSVLSVRPGRAGPGEGRSALAA